MENQGSERGNESGVFGNKEEWIVRKIYRVKNEKVNGRNHKGNAKKKEKIRLNFEVGLWNDDGINKRNQ